MSRFSVAILPSRFHQNIHKREFVGSAFVSEDSRPTTLRSERRDHGLNCESEDELCGRGGASRGGRPVVRCHASPLPRFRGGRCHHQRPTTANRRRRVAKACTCGGDEPATTSTVAARTSTPRRTALPAHSPPNRQPPPRARQPPPPQNLYRAGAFTPKSAYQSRPKSNYQSSAKKMEKVPAEGAHTRTRPGPGPGPAFSPPPPPPPPATPTPTMIDTAGATRLTVATLARHTPYSSRSRC